jgi:hypothetical protein
MGAKLGDFSSCSLKSLSSMFFAPNSVPCAIGLMKLAPCHTDKGHEVNFTCQQKIKMVQSRGNRWIAEKQEPEKNRHGQIQKTIEFFFHFCHNQKVAELTNRAS